MAAVRDELLSGTVSRIAIVIFSASVRRTGSVKIMERFVLDVSQFPVVEKGERNIEVEWESDASSSSVEGRKGKGKAKQKPKPLDADVDVDVSENFRAALITLTTRCAQLAPLPPECSFSVAMELKDDTEVDPPVRHPQPWIPVQPSLQKTGRKGRVDEEGKRAEGEDLGGARVTPIRSVEAGVFRFETWIEEGKAKFEIDEGDTEKSSFGSSVG